MANMDFILQGLSATDDHFGSVHEVFKLSDIASGLVASAFMNAAGASIIADIIAPYADRIKVFVGVRNDVTTLQAIQMLVNKNIFPYLVDTATQAYIFHPKVYVARNTDNSRLIVGSANATTGGLVKNIEAGVYLDPSMQISDEKRIVEKVFEAFDSLVEKFKENVFRITPETDLNELVAQGILLDQNKVLYQTRMRANGTTRTDTRRRMLLNTRTLPRTNRTARQKTEKIKIQGTQASVIAIKNDTTKRCPDKGITTKRCP